jgi:hypothetical protein
MTYEQASQQPFGSGSAACQRRRRMTTPKCAYCGVEITPENRSREHILQNAIGGRKEVPNVFCHPCNSTFGHRWDSEAAQQLHFLSLKLEVVRDDGEVPARYYQTISGKSVRLHPDGHMSLPPEKPVVIEKDGQVQIQITAPNRRRAVEALQGQKRRYPKLDVGAAIASMTYNESYLDEPIAGTLQFQGHGPYRSAVKSALTLAVSAGIRAEKCERALKFLKPDGQFCFGFYYRRNLIVNRPADRVFHCVGIKGDPRIGKLVGYVELFSIYRFVIALSENYNGPEIADSYSIDPAAGETLDLKLDLSFTEEQFRFAVDNMDETAVAARYQAAQSVIGFIQRRSFQREQERVARQAWYGTLKTLGLEPGQPMTPEIAMAMSREITNRMLPFLKRRISAQISKD